MGWFDWIKEIPLSAVQKEKIALVEFKLSETEKRNAELETESISLRKENATLKQENASLQARLDAAQKQISHLQAETYKTKELMPVETTLQWTDYTEDVFHGVIWRWHYKTKIDHTPRDLTPYCPECKNPTPLNRSLVKTYRSTDPRTLKLQCSYHPQWYIIPVPTNIRAPSGALFDEYLNIKELIQQKLQDGTWKDVVNRKHDQKANDI